MGVPTPGKIHVRWLRNKYYYKYNAVRNEISKPRQNSCNMGTKQT